MWPGSAPHTVNTCATGVAIVYLLGIWSSPVPCKHFCILELYATPVYFSSGATCHTSTVSVTPSVAKFQARSLLSFPELSNSIARYRYQIQYFLLKNVK